MEKKQIYRLNPTGKQVEFGYLVDNIIWKCKNFKGIVTEYLKEDISSNYVFEYRNLIPTW